MAVSEEMVRQNECSPVGGWMDGGRRGNVKLEEIVYGASTAFEPPAKLNS